jgi:wobble nucleotide-excising tRNase
VVLQFENGHKVSFQNGAWSEQRAELLVYDVDFVGRNVHSGGVVSTDHRKNLLEFALGEAAVSARTTLDIATAQAKVASEEVRNVTNLLSGYHTGLTLAQFEQLAQLPDILQQIDNLQRRINAASNIAAIQTKPIPKQTAEPAQDIDSAFEILNLSLADIHANAEQVVKQHIEALGNPEAESWLSQGQQYASGDSCPYCGQDVTGNELILAYQTHFNLAYSNLKAKVRTLLNSLSDRTAPSVIATVAQSIQLAVAQTGAWTDHVSLQAITFDDNAAQTALIAFREQMLNLTQQKIAAPAESVGTEADKEKAIALWNEVLCPIRNANAAIKAAEQVILGYKGQLSIDNVQVLNQQFAVLQATQRRYEPAVIQLLARLVTARLASQNAETAKQNARTALDAIMATTLGKYQSSINTILKHFGAAFSIQGFSANYRGKAPRSEYGILLRGKSIALEGGPPSFSTALSEGDKRTLAFAFFIASTLADPKLAERIVVVDDPMSSLDLNRKHATRTVLKKIHAKAKQLIVFAHDPYFLRDLRDTLYKENPAVAIAEVQLVGGQNNYTVMAKLDIDKECESHYSQHHRLLNEFTAGVASDPKAVAKAVRPLLEGYLHRRFPGLIPKNLVFGQVVTQIRDSQPPSPLCYAQNIVDELNEINDYAGQFHHDTNINADSVIVVANELKPFVERALCVVHKGAPL